MQTSDSGSGPVGGREGRRGEERGERRGCGIVQNTLLYFTSNLSGSVYCLFTYMYMYINMCIRVRVFEHVCM